MVELNGKCALVTGGSRGIGRAIALRLAESGANVGINYLRNRSAADKTIAELSKYDITAKAYKANVANEEHLHSLFKKFKEDYGRLDIMISNAASGILKPALELTQRHWNWTMGINASTLLHLVQHAMPLIGEDGGKIVAISSLGSVRAIPNYTAVGASKAALESLVRHLSIELAPKNVNVNTLSAGVVDTDALKHFPNREEIINGSLAKTPAGRLTTPEDVADVALFLVSPSAKMIHGQTIVVDGGYSIVA
ncbi:MAG: enoyl-[acyl-carrier-protein] reductase FabL [Candidatus Electryonea clarkiae]|nr:enoyl-[acyl-carrier-protein] reductase FabL [Candidatus Electryonea clarkiae]